MIESAIAQAIFKLTLAVLAILVARGTLLWMDKAFDVKFFDALEESSANAQVGYFAARFVGVCILVGLVVS